MRKTRLSRRPGRAPALLAGCAIGAMLVALSSPAAAQSFNGTPTVVAGSALITPGAGSHDIIIQNAETVINWAAVDGTGSGAIDFQPAGTTAVFRDGGGLADYTVLNRILPVNGSGAPTASTVSFNGTVNSLLANVQGGNVWFYSPTGIIVGPTAQFNVGSLILTTDDIQFVPAAIGPGSIYGPGGLVQFRGSADSTGFVAVQAGAQINAQYAAGTSAYVALVAPRVVQNGTVRADGPIGYIAGEQLDMTINAGLFDFAISVGTTDANGIVHGGTTTGPASTALTDQQRISMVALPKNSALTMLLSGVVGYAPAATAASDGSSIVLTAGFTNNGPTVVPANRLGNIQIGSVDFRNRLTGYATDTIDLASVSATRRFEGDTTKLLAVNAIDLTAGVAETVEAFGALGLYAGAPGVGGTINVSALSGSTLSVTGGLTLVANGDAAFYDKTTPFLDGTGGSITVLADGGTISVLADANNPTLPPFLYADGTGVGNFDAVAGGTGIGGTIAMTVTGNGSITAASTSLFAGGSGGASAGTSAGIGGVGTGGLVTVRDNGGVLGLGSVGLYATGGGGDADGQAGNGTGGHVVIDIHGQAQNWADLYVDASGTAGLPIGAGAGGEAVSPTDAIAMTVTGPGSLTLAANAYLGANAYSAMNGAAGFAGQAGGVALTVGGGGTLVAGGTIVAEADALFNSDLLLGSALSTPNQRGGAVTVTADGGSITAAGLEASADATGSYAATSAGTAMGGSATVMARNGGAITALGAGQALTVSANGYGAPGVAAADAVGGTARLIAEDGTVNVTGGAVVTASGKVADLATIPLSATGFDARGGVAAVELRPGTLGTASVDAGSLDVLALGDARFIPNFGSPPPGGNPIDGNAGNGAGGTASLTVGAGNLTVAAASVDSSGTGGASGASNLAVAFRSGNGTGGVSRLSATGGTSSISNLSILALGTGGGGAPDANSGQLASAGGGATGGTAELFVSNGLLDAPVINVEASALGADGMGHLAAGGLGGNGGFAVGGTTRFTMPGGSTGRFTTTQLNLDSRGFAGAGGNSLAGVGGNGGDATGGSAIASLSDGAFVLGPFRAYADGYGGFGLDGGLGAEGHGGSAQFSVVDSAGPAGVRSVDDISLFASGFSGSGASGFAATDAGSTTLVVHAANAASAISTNGGLLANSRGTRGAPGAGFTVSVAGAPFDIGGNAFVDTARDAVITAAQPFNINGILSLNARSLTETGQLAATGPIAITTTDFLAAERIRSGATTSLSATNGPLTVSIDLASAGNVSATARSIDIHSLGALSFGLTQATGGNLSIATVNDLTLPTANATGAITLASSSGSIVSATALNAGGAFAANGATGVNLATVSSGGTTSLQSAGGAIGVTSLTSAGAVTASGRSVTISSTGGLTFADLRATAGDIGVSVGGPLTLTQANATGAINLLVSTGGLVGTGPIAAGGLVNIDSASGIDLAILTSGATTQLRAAGGPVAIDNLLSAGAVSVLGQSVDIASTAGLTFASASATAGGARIQTGGALTAQTVSASGLVDLRSGGPLHTIGDVSGGAIALQSNGNFDADANLVSAGNLAINVLGTFTLAGSARGTTVTVASSNIVLGSGAALGRRGLTTDLTVLNLNPAVTTNLGGAAQGYSLDQAEALRLFADIRMTLGVQAATVPAGTGNIAIGDLAMSFGATGNIGAGGTLKVSGPATIDIVGDVALTTASAADTFTIDPTLVRLNTDTGSIALLSGSGAPLGQLRIVGDTVAVATGAVLGQIGSASGIRSLSALLDVPGNTADPLRAGSIYFDVVGGLYIQNTGASTRIADRRGFTTGAIAIDTASPSTRIVINGQLLRPIGSVTGTDVTPLITINGTAAAAGGRFDPASTVNGCLIGRLCFDVAFNPPNSEDLETPVGSDEGAGSLFVAPLIQLADTEPLITPPLVDEPITGVGNDDLWQPPCDDPDEDCDEGDEGQ